MMPTLRSFSLLLALAALFIAAPNCVTTGTPTPVTPSADGGVSDAGPTPTQVFGTCSSDALRKTGESLIGRITTALATGDYESQITQLLTGFTSAEIGCGVDLVVSLYTKKAARTDDPETHVVLAHAQDWRKLHPVN